MAKAAPGDKFNHLTVLSLEYSRNWKRYWRVRCDCGSEFVIVASSLGISKTCGRCNRIKPLAERFWRNVEKSETCWRYVGNISPQGYGRIGQGATSILAHRLSWELAHGPIANDLCVLHKCDNPKCVNPSHLFLGTRPENQRDMAEKQRSCHGEQNHCAKLTAAMVLDVRRRYDSGERLQDIANDAHITYKMVWNIGRRRNWRHIPEPTSRPTASLST